MEGASIESLPDALLSQIIALITQPRSRNSASLVNVKWRSLERASRTHLTLRGNIRNLLFHLPDCFTSATSLDLSCLSPWGVYLSSQDDLLCHCLRRAFPSVSSLTLYSRSPSTLTLLLPVFPSLHSLKLIRWHQRPTNTPRAADFLPVFHFCKSLTSLDLSSFYFWTEDLLSALDSSSISSNLLSLNLLNSSLSEGFKADQILRITSLCPNLTDFRVGCNFNPRYIGFIGDDALLSIPANCTRLKVLHLVDISQVDRQFDDHGFSTEDAGFSLNSLTAFFAGLKVIEELVLDVWQNVRGSWVCLETLGSKCPSLRSLQLGCFHGVCKAIESHLDGIALCHGLESLTIKNSADLTNFGLIAIGRGCSKLAKFEVEGCRNITRPGLRTMVCLLRNTLVEVRISGCKHLNALESLRAVEPIKDRIKRLHIDCVWGSFSEVESRDDIIEEEYCRVRKRSRISPGTNNWFMMNGSSIMGDGSSTSNGHLINSWERLEFLSLWMGVGELLTPLCDVGLEDCPNLREIHIKVEGDSREQPKPSEDAFGISTLSRYPMLSKMKLDCGDTIGFALTAPSGHMDLSLWERWFLTGIRMLSLDELDYWPPQDREVNQRSLSLPAVSLLAESETLRKLFIHGTAHEHFMMDFFKIPNLRDVQLRGDYYPAPENDMSTEMRVDSCYRFESKLNARQIPD